ncbi:MAG: FecR domain-containing protein [Candidatus Omnitrophica bacterium]|nr:FecR domain-containing protein [Candidatus Omnitrophota bacterium]
MEKRIQMMPPEISPQKPWGLWIFFALILLVIVPFVALAVIYFQQPEPDPFRIANFAGHVEVYSHQKNAWVPAERNGKFGTHDKVRTSSGAEVDLRLGDDVFIRLKENSQLEGKRPRLFDQFLTHRLHLLKGSLIGATDKKFKGKGHMEITTPVLVAAVRGTLFRVEADEKSGESTISVLRGRLEVSPRQPGTDFLPKELVKTRPIVIGNTEKVLAKPGEMNLVPVRISAQDWNQIKEAYELIQKSAAFEAEQLDLSTKAGAFFEYVFDHGTFYTQKFGFAEREFMKDESTGEVHLDIDYDVFSKGSFVGIYMKVRKFDLSDYKGLSFDVRKVDEEGVPEAFKMELKSKGDVARAMKFTEFRKDWRTLEFPFSARQATPLTELTIVFTHDTVGEAKKGALQLRNFNLIPLTEEERATIQKNRERKAGKAPQEPKELREETKIQKPSAEKQQEVKSPPPAKPLQSSDESVWQNF